MFTVGNEPVNCMHFQTPGLQVVNKLYYIMRRIFNFFFTKYIKRSHHEKLCISAHAFLIQGFLTDFIVDTGITREISLVHGTFQCPRNEQAVFSIHDGVPRIFHRYNPRPHYGPGFDSASNRNDYQGYIMGGKAACAGGQQTCHLHVPVA